MEWIELSDEEKVLIHIIITASIVIRYLKKV